MALEQRPKSLSGLAQTGSVSNFSQSGSIVHLDYGTQLDPTTMACDPFYSVNELYTFAAYSEVQFLNMVEKKLAARPGSTSTNHSQPDPTLSNFLYCKERLDDHVQQIQDTLASIKNRGGSEWLRALGGNSNRKEAEAAALATAQDYEYLLGRARSLSARCDQSMNIVMNNAMIRESEKAILQAEGIAKLTRLAFFYIPLSFTTSFFGMNFLQFGTGNKSIWVWFACSGPVFTLSIIFLMWDVPGMARKVLRYDAWINWIRKKFT